VKREKKISYCCPFVPAEWIAAHGFDPHRFFPVGKENNPSAGVAGLCSYAGAVVEEAFTNDDSEVMVLTTLCDQMRRATDLLTGKGLSSFFLMHVPTVYGNEEARRLYRDELERLGRFLVRHGGTRAADGRTAEIMMDFDIRRSELRASRNHLTGLQFTEACMEFQKTGKFTSPVSSSEQKSPGVRIGLLGGPLMERHLNIIDFIEQSGGTIALDGTDTGERSLPAPFDRSRIAEDPLEALTTAYFDNIPHPFRRPDVLFYQWLDRETEARSINGLLILRHTWCDIWHGEVARLKEWSDIPVLDIDMGGQDNGNENRIKNRIIAFLEMLV